MERSGEGEYTESEKILLERTLLEVANLEIPEFARELNLIAHLMNSAETPGYTGVIEEVIALMDQILELPKYAENKVYAGRLRSAKKILRKLNKYKFCWGCESILKQQANICLHCHHYRFSTQIRVIVATSARSGLKPPVESLDGLIA